MKKKLSLFELQLAATWKKILGVLAAMAALETGIFYYNMKNTVIAACQSANHISLEEYLSQGGDITSLWIEFPLDAQSMMEPFESLIGYPFVLLMFLTIFALAFLLQNSTGSIKGNDYFLKRLNVSARSQMILNGGYCFLSLSFFWMIQILLVLAFGYWYRQAVGNAISPQFLFIAFMDNTFLHNLLPLKDPFTMCGNAVYLVTISVLIAVHKQYKVQNLNIPLILYVTAIGLIYNTEVNDDSGLNKSISLLTIFCSIVLIIRSVYYAHGKENE